MPARPKVLGIKIHHVASADPKVAAIKTLMIGECRADHHFHYCKHLTARQGMCSWHHQNCDLTGMDTEDFFSAGFPCAPFSIQRPGRQVDPNSWRKHRETPAMFEVLQYLSVNKPKCGMLENVDAFASQTGSDSPLDELNRHFDDMAIYAHRSMAVKTNSWINNNRSRWAPQQCQPSQTLESRGARRIILNIHVMVPCFFSERQLAQFVRLRLASCSAIRMPPKS